MHLLLSLVLPLLVLSLGECASISNNTNTRSKSISFPISVTNGLNWVEWGRVDWCPYGTYATGFSLKVHPAQGIWRDDTALNGISLVCSRSSYKITSNVGGYGSWTPVKSCAKGVMTAFQLRVQPYQYAFDDSSANNIRFLCSGNQILEGDGMDWGSWGQWSQICPGTGICGIQTKVSPNNRWDDTSLDNVLFYCCS